MQSRLRHFVAVVLSAALSLIPAAASAQSRVHGVARLGLEYGGDPVIEFEYEDGSTPEVTAGGGLLLTVGGGAQIATFGRHVLDAQLNAGIKWRTIPAATNQDANWLRIPVEGILFYRMPSGFRVGAGAVVHLANALKSSGAVLNDRVEFKNTPGFLLQGEYIRGNMAFDLRYTFLDYETEFSGSESIDALSIGVGVSFFFGRGRPAAAGTTTTDQP